MGESKVVMGYKFMSRYTLNSIAWIHEALISVVGPSLAADMVEDHSTKDFVSLDFSGEEWTELVLLGYITHCLTLHC
jgi:hypothetical protein